MPRPRLSSCAVLVLATLNGVATAQTANSNIEMVEVRANYLNGVGTSDAASEGAVTSSLIASRPTLRPGEVLEFVPGVIVSQHSGDGKANQYYLRGFNLDHGTDFATFVDGVPVNMPTHAHGQGYSDLNWLIPELVERINYRKGPYFAEQGDFASAGSARIRLVDSLTRGLASATIGEDRLARGLIANSTALGDGDLLYAIDVGHNDGPWQHPEDFCHVSTVLRYGAGGATDRWSLTAMAYSARWNATDQIPLRAIESGLIGRFGAVDPTDHGNTSRYSLSYGNQRTLNDGELKLNAYAIDSRLDLFSDFTYFLENPAEGDQFEQAEHRNVFGAEASRSWNLPLAGLDSTHTLGLQLRHDRLDPVGLYDARGGERTSTIQQSTVRETSVGLYAQTATQWTPWFRSVTGVRADRFFFDVASSIAANSGKREAGTAGPKLSLIFGPWRHVEYFANFGYGFHSNDARGVTESVTPKTRLPATVSQPLIRSRGDELGIRAEPLEGLQSSVALWQLVLDSELVFSGDAGDTQPSGKSRRYGVEFNNHYIVTTWLLLDGDLALSRAKFTTDQGTAPNLGRYVPGSANTVASFGATVSPLGPWFGQLQLRDFGPRPLIEDDSQRSRSTTLTYARIGARISRDAKLALDVFNVFNRQASDIDYYYASRLRGEPTQGVNDVHFHPVEPRSFRLTLSMSF
ncbi:MAG TPA: TonB-dependent receptor plug domain-containing protein [Burkholderiaceae bacterium]